MDPRGWLPPGHTCLALSPLSVLKRKSAKEKVLGSQREGGVGTSLLRLHVTPPPQTGLPLPSPGQQGLVSLSLDPAL